MVVSHTLINFQVLKLSFQVQQVGWLAIPLLLLSTKEITEELRILRTSSLSLVLIWEEHQLMFLGIMNNMNISLRQKYLGSVFKLPNSISIQLQLVVGQDYFLKEVSIKSAPNLQVLTLAQFAIVNLEEL